MTLNPFVMGSAAKPSCFDERSPCILEQTSMCVIEVAQKADAQSKFPGQSKYVPWLVCMDSGGDKTSACNNQVGVDSAAVATCLKSDAPALLKKYIASGKSINQTPTVHVNGKNVKTSYKAIHTAICKEDPSLKGCSAEMPSWADLEPRTDPRPQGAVVV